MFLLNGNPISLDVAFTTPDGTQYRANWIRLATPEQRAAIGITEAPDQIPHDQRYYWGYDADGNLIPKQLEDETITPEEGNSYIQTGLKTQHINQNKQTANTLLAPTDWYIVRKFERDVDVPVGIASYRAAVIDVAEERETLISSVTSVAELKSLYESSVTGIGTDSVTNPPAMPNWPSINN